MSTPLPQARGCALLATLDDPYGRVHALTPDAVDAVAEAMGQVATMAEVARKFDLDSRRHGRTEAAMQEGAWCGSNAMRLSLYDAAVDVASYGADVLQHIPGRDLEQKRGWSGQAIPLLLLCMYHLYGEAGVQMSAMRALYNFCLGDTQCSSHSSTT